MKAGAIRDYTLDEFNLDYICNGRQLLYLYKARGDESTCGRQTCCATAAPSAAHIRRGILAQKVLPPYQMWLDGLHMSTPFYGNTA